jgi:ribosomal protein L32
MDYSHFRAKAANFFCKQGHSVETAHTVTVKSLIESNKQTNDGGRMIVELSEGHGRRTHHLQAECAIRAPI